MPPTRLTASRANTATTCKYGDEDCPSKGDSPSRGARVRDDLELIVVRFPAGDLTAAEVVDRILELLRQESIRHLGGAVTFLNKVRDGVI